MGDIARCSLGKDSEYYNEELLYRAFGINAELLIDHAWGWEPCTIADIKAYQPAARSLESGQVLKEPYTVPKARVVLREMADQMALGLVEKRLLASSISIHVSFDSSCLEDPEIRKAYKGPVSKDYYGRKAPKSVSGSFRFPHPTSSTSQIMEAVTGLYDRLVDPCLLVRRFSLDAGEILSEDLAQTSSAGQQLDLFAEQDGPKAEETKKMLEKEKKLQQALLSIKDRYGRNSVLRGMNYEEGATGKERNEQIGGHRA